MTLDSTINDSACYNSDEDDAESDQKRDSLVATHTSDRKKRKVTDADTTNINSPQKILIKRTLPMIIPPIDPWVEDGVEAGRGTTYARQTLYLEVIIPDAAHSGAHVFRTPADTSQTNRDEKNPRDGNTSISYLRLNSPVLIGGGTTVPPTRTESQNIGSPKGPTGSVEVRNAQTDHGPDVGITYV